MSFVLPTMQAPAVLLHRRPSFKMYRSQAEPIYYQLMLEDGAGCQVQWVLSQPLKQLVKQRAVLLWQLPCAGPAGALTCLDAGTMQLVPAHPGTLPDLRADLAAGTLRLNFSGQLLRGYFRLQCLPAGSGQLWQLTPIGHV